MGRIGHVGCTPQLTRHDPSFESRQALLDKRNRLLIHLHKKGILDTSTYELAISEPLPQEPLPLPHIAPHLTDYFYQTRNGKYSVSTIDRGIQTQIESLVERWNSESQTE